MSDTVRTRRATGRRRIALIAVALAGIVLALRLLDTATPFFSYRTPDDQTIILETVSGPGTWTRVTSVTETPTSVTIQVSSLRAPLPGAGDDQLELTVTLRDPIGGRAVIDGSFGATIRESGAR